MSMHSILSNGMMAPWRFVRLGLPGNAHRVAISMAAALLALSPLAAHAQDAADNAADAQDEDDDFDAMSRLESRRVAQAFGECVARRHPVAAAAYVNADINISQPLTDEQWRRVSDGDCMPPSAAPRATRLRFRGEALRYALANGLAGRVARPLTAEDVTAQQPLSRVLPELPSPNARLTGEQQARLTQTIANFELRLLGECVVRADPVAARQLVESSVGSDAERDAMQAVAANLPGCVAAGSEMRLNRYTIRGVVAMSYYQLAVAAGIGTES